MLAWLLNSVVIVVFRELSADEEEKYYKEAYKKFKPSNLKPRVSMCMYTCVHVCVCARMRACVAYKIMSLYHIMEHVIRRQIQVKNCQISQDCTWCVCLDTCEMTVTFCWQWSDHYHMLQ